MLFSNKKQTLSPEALKVYRQSRAKFSESFQPYDYELYCMGSLTALECLRLCLPETVECDLTEGSASVILTALCKTVVAAAYIKRNVKSGTGFSWNIEAATSKKGITNMMENALLLACHRLTEGLSSDCPKIAMECLKIQSAMVLPPPDDKQP